MSSRSRLTTCKRSADVYYVFLTQARKLTTFHFVSKPTAIIYSYLNGTFGLSSHVFQSTFHTAHKQNPKHFLVATRTNTGIPHLYISTNDCTRGTFLRALPDASLSEKPFEVAQVIIALCCHKFTWSVTLPLTWLIRVGLHVQSLSPYNV